ncbi:Retrovirus-related Pol polyprotein from transposon opus [Dictyocoela muelleri]|nr:Retrovirus-related Pol polyprotein from transposon opus [Dictyocoela muelleri]
MDCLNIIVKRVQELDDNFKCRNYEVNNKLDTFGEIKYGKARIQPNSEFGKSPRFDKRNFSPKLCFKCSKPGHIAKFCNEKNESNLSNGKCNNLNLELEDIRLNELETKALFDSGSSINIITRKTLKQLKISEIRVLDEFLKIKLLNGSIIKSNITVRLTVSHENKMIKNTFYVINNSIVDIILGRELIEKFKRTREFPVKCHMKTVSDKIVSWSRPIRNIKDKNDFKGLINCLEKDGIVEKSNSLWLNPVVLNRKKSGDLRFTLDLRRVNEIVRLDDFEIPNIQNIIRSLNGKRVFSLIDLKDGFFQVPLSKEDREKTSFLDSNYRLMQFTRMPQGFKNSPAIFQRGMNIILEELVGKICLNYIDDILIFSENIEEHKQNLVTVKERLNEYNLKINEEKSQYNKSEIEFLGYKIDNDNIVPLLKRSDGY